MDDEAVRQNYADKLRFTLQCYGGFGVITAIRTVVFLFAKFCITTYAEGRDFHTEDILQFVYFIITGITVLFLSFLAVFSLYALRLVLLSRRGSVVSPRAIVTSIHHQTAVLFTLVSLNMIAVCVIQDTVTGLLHNVWCACIIGYIVVAELVFEHRGDSTAIEVKEWPVYKFAIGHAIFEIAILMGLIFYGERILDTRSGLRAVIGAAPNPHFTVVFNVFALMTLFTWFNTRAACLGYSKKLFISPVFWTALSACVIMQVLIIQFGESILWAHPLTLWQWSVSIGVAALVLVCGVIINGIPPKALPSNAASIRYQAAVKD